MKSKVLQQLVSKIFGDENTKREFQENPESVLARYDLTEQEKKAVLLTHKNFGLVASGSEQFEETIQPTGGWFAPVP
jgi:restriction endonuclease Mrr